MSKLCITTVVDEAYMHWLPAFVYCVNRAYPQYFVRLFVRDPIKYNLKKWKLNCDIVPMFEDFPRYKYLSIALRFAIDKEFYEGFDFVYVTDIDMMIMIQVHNIEYFHCMEMNDTNLCYSNSLRNATHYAGSESLSGLHFATKKWFEMTNDLVKDYRKNMEDGLLGLYREYDGVMLYRIAEKCGCGLPGKYKLTNRHHGIHMANWRLFGAEKYKLDTRISNESRKQWVIYRSNKVFNDIINECSIDSKDMREEVDIIDRYCTGKL